MKATAMAALPLGAALAVLSWATHLQPATTAWPLAWGAYLVAFAIYGAIMVAWRMDKLRFDLRTALIAAAALHLILLPSLPFFSDDVWRYIWDGHVQLGGINPYQHAPDSPALSHLHNDVWPKINHPEVPTIYPPAAQLAFALCAAILPGTTSLRLLMILTEALTLLGLWRLARPTTPEAPTARTDRRAWLTVALLWNPLMIVEFAGSAHLDILAIAPLVWALALIKPQPSDNQDDAPGEGDCAPTHWKPWLLSGLALGVSINAKLLGVGLLPVLLMWAWWPRRWHKGWRSHGGVRRITALAAGLAIAISVTAAPYATPAVFGQSGSFTKGLSTYARKWRANDGAFAVLVHTQEAILSLAPGAAPDNDRPYWRMDKLGDTFKALEITHEHDGKEVASTTFTRTEAELSLAKLYVALLMGALMLLVLNQRYGPSASALILLSGVLLLAPTVHPWYVTWLVPLALAHRSLSIWLWSALVVLAYGSAMQYAFSGVWHESVWLRLGEYIPVFIVLAWEASRRIVGQPTLPRRPNTSPKPH